MHANPLRFRWMQLHHDFLSVTKQILDEAHLRPIRTAIRKRDAHVFPRNTEFLVTRARNYLEFASAGAFDEKLSEWLSGICGELTVTNATAFQTWRELHVRFSFLAVQRGE